MVKLTTPVTGTVSLSHLCPLPPVLSLLKPTAHVCTPKMAEDGLRLTVPLPPVSPAVYKPPFPVTRPLWRAGAVARPGTWCPWNLGLGSKTPVPWGMTPGRAWKRV
jgi:hypothetical protein